MSLDAVVSELNGAASIEPGSAVTHVEARTAGKQIVVSATLKLVAAKATVDAVTMSPAPDLIRPGSGTDDVVSAKASDLVGSAARDDHIPTGGTHDLIGTWSSNHRCGQALALQRRLGCRRARRRQGGERSENRHRQGRHSLRSDSQAHLQGHRIPLSVQSPWRRFTVCVRR